MAEGEAIRHAQAVTQQPLIVEAGAKFFFIFRKKIVVTGATEYREVIGRQKLESGIAVQAETGFLELVAILQLSRQK